jgi:tetratricopeptide (TPR) repeat protein
VKKIWFAVTLIILFAVALPCRAQEKSKREKALELCAEGEALIYAGRIDEALEKYTKAIDVDIKCIKAHKRYQDILLETGKRDKLLEDYREFVHIMPKSAFFNYLYGRLHADDLDIEQKYYKKAVELDPKFFDARFALGLSCLSGKQYKEALEQLKECEKLQPKDIILKFRMADVFLKLGDYDKARECYKKVEQLQPGDGVVQYALGRSYAYQGKHEEALKYYEKADKLGLVDKNFIVQWAQSCVGTGDKKKAVEVYEKLFLTDAAPRDFSMVEQEILTFCEPFSDLNQPQKAQLAKAIQLLEGEEPKPDEAAAVLAELAPKAPKSEAVQYFLGRALLATNKKKEAVAAFKKSAELNPGYPVPVVYLALIDYVEGKYASAQKGLLHALSLDPFSAEANTYTALLMTRLEKYRDALKYAKRTYQLTGTIRNVSGVFYFAELYLEDDSLYLDEFDVGPWKVKVYKGLPQVDPERVYAYRFLAKKDGKIDRIIVVNSRRVRDVDGPDPDLFATYHFLEETLRTGRGIRDIRHENFGKNLPELDGIIKCVKKILNASLPGQVKEERKEK